MNSSSKKKKRKPPVRPSVDRSDKGRGKAESVNIEQSPVEESKTTGAFGARTAKDIRPATRRPRLLQGLIILFALWLAVLIYLAIRVNS